MIRRDPAAGGPSAEFLAATKRGTPALSSRTAPQKNFFPARKNDFFLDIHFASSYN